MLPYIQSPNMDSTASNYVCSSCGHEAARKEVEMQPNSRCRKCGGVMELFRPSTPNPKTSPELLMPSHTGPNQLDMLTPDEEVMRFATQIGGLPVDRSSIRSVSHKDYNLKRK